MSFFKKIKQGLGIGTLEAKLEVPREVDRNCGELAGDFILTAKIDQEIQHLTVKFEKIRRWEEERKFTNSDGHTDTRTQQESETIEIASFNDENPFELRSGEVKTIHFAFPFQASDLVSPEQEEMEKGTLSMMMGTLANAFDNVHNERYEYHVVGKVDLKDVAIDPKDSVNIKVT